MNFAALVDKLKEKVEVLDRERTELTEENAKLKEQMRILQSTVKNLRNELLACHQVEQESRELIDELETIV